MTAVPLQKDWLLRTLAQIYQENPDTEASKRFRETYDKVVDRVDGDLSTMPSDLSGDESTAFIMMRGLEPKMKGCRCCMKYSLFPCYGCYWLTCLPLGSICNKSWGLNFEGVTASTLCSAECRVIKEDQKYCCK